MAATGMLDLEIIRTIVNRMEHELGPGARASDIEREASRVLRELAAVGRSGNGLLLMDVDPGVLDSGTVPRAVREAVVGRGGPAIWVRHAIDLGGRQAGHTAQARIETMRHMLTDLLPRATDARLLLAVAFTDGAADSGWIADALSQVPELYVTVVCARPGIGVDTPLLARVVNLHGALSASDRNRLTVRCARIPVGRSGGLRIERAVPHDSMVRGDGGPATAMLPVLTVPICAPSEQWTDLMRAGIANDRIRPLRVDGWPAAGVRPFGGKPLCAPPDRLADHLLALSASGAEASVRIDRLTDSTPP